MKRILLLVLFFPSLSFGATRWADASLSGGPCTSGNYSSSGHNCSGSEGNAYTTINSALTGEAAGDTINVRSGTYNETMNDVIASGGGSWATATTVKAYASETVTIRPTCGATCQAFDIESGSYMIIDGFHIDGVNAASPTKASIGIRVQGSANHIRIIRNETYNWRQGIGVFSSASTRVTACEIQYNHSHNNGSQNNADHGIYLSADTSIVEHNDVHDNWSYGIHIFGSSSSNYTYSNIVRYNRSYNNGVEKSGTTSNASGILIGTGNSNIAYNNVVYGNPIGMRIGFSGAGNALYNNTIYKNDTSGGNIGVYLSAGPTGSIVRNNIIYSQATPINDAQSGATKDHNLTTDPTFVNAGTFDLHIQTTSAAKDVGATLSPTVTDDYDGVLRPQGSAYDEGAYEYFNATPPALVWLSPSGGLDQHALIGSTLIFTWSSTGAVTNVDILESFDSGATYPKTIISNSPDDGSQSWIVAAPSGSNVRFKIQMTGTPSVNNAMGQDMRIAGHYF